MHFNGSFFSFSFIILQKMMSFDVDGQLTKKQQTNFVNVSSHYQPSKNALFCDLFETKSYCQFGEMSKQLVSN